MGMQIYQKNQYKVYKAGRNCIAHNSDYSFNDKHTHLHNLAIAKKVIRCVIRKEIPRSFNIYLLESLIRISDDEEYISKIRCLIEVREGKDKKRYFNSQKKKGGVRA